MTCRVPWRCWLFGHDRRPDRIWLFGVCRRCGFRFEVPHPVQVADAARVVEVTIGLWDDETVPAGQNPPQLAAAILAALGDAGYRVVYVDPARSS